MAITKRSIIAMAGAATFALTSIPTSVAAADFEPTKPVDFVPPPSWLAMLVVARMPPKPVRYSLPRTVQQMTRFNCMG